MSLRFAAYLAGFLLSAGYGQSGVITLITLTPEDLVFQQTAASPCVIGGPNCLNGGFPYTLAGSGGGGTEFDETSPLYSLTQVTDITGSSNFTIALDYNDSSVPQTLRLFEASYFSASNGTNLIGTDAYTGPTSLKTNNNGVGFSDFLLEGFMIPAGTQSVQFRAQWLNNSGADRYFLVPGTSAPSAVPEPSSIFLLGAGLLAAGTLFRRKASLSGGDGRAS